MKWEPESHWDEHPDFSAADWRRDVDECNTRQSYVDWVNSQIEQKEEARLMPRYNHAYSLGFEVISDTEDASDVTPAMLRVALMRRVEDLDRHDEWEEAVGGGPFDTHEEED